MKKEYRKPTFNWNWIEQIHQIPLWNDRGELMGLIEDIRKAYYFDDHDMCQEIK